MLFRSKFLREDGSKLRPWDDVEEMDEFMIKAWNEIVKPEDKVYHLGDVVINRKALKMLYRLNGDKVLIKGNHDIFGIEDYAPHFRDIRAYHVVNKFILSHIPVHPESQGRFEGNIHGHLHHRHVMKGKVVDPFYKCVCVEHTDWRPILLDDVFKKFER